MSRSSTGRGDTGRHRWRPVTPVSAMVVGRLVLGLPSTFGLTVIVLIWSALTGAGLGFIWACLFSLVAVAIREIIDASAHRLIMRAWRSRDPHLCRYFFWNYCVKVFLKIYLVDYKFLCGFYICF